MCDRCGGSLVQRDDDRPESIGVRMNAYQEGTTPLKAYYELRKKLRVISATGSPAETLERSLNSLNERLARTMQTES